MSLTSELGDVMRKGSGVSKGQDIEEFTFHSLGLDFQLLCREMSKGLGQGSDGYKFCIFNCSVLM